MEVGGKESPIYGSKKRGRSTKSGEKAKDGNVLKQSEPDVIDTGLNSRSVISL